MPKNYNKRSQKIKNINKNKNSEKVIITVDLDSILLIVTLGMVGLKV